MICRNSAAIRRWRFACAKVAKPVFAAPNSAVNFRVMPPLCRRCLPNITCNLQQDGFPGGCAITAISAKKCGVCAHNCKPLRHSARQYFFMPKLPALRKHKRKRRYPPAPLCPMKAASASAAILMKLKSSPGIRRTIQPAPARVWKKWCKKAFIMSSAPILTRPPPLCVRLPKRTA